MALSFIEGAITMATVMSISAAPNLRFSPGATVMTVGVANLVEQGRLLSLIHI